MATQLGGFVRDPGGMITSNPPDGSAVFYAGSALEDFEVTPGMNIMLDAHGTLEQYAWDGGKTWAVGDEPTTHAVEIGNAAADAMDEMQAAMRPGNTAAHIIDTGRDVLRRHHLPEAESAMLFCHSVGLDLIDLEHGYGRGNWTIEKDMIVAGHVVVPGDRRHRLYLEGIAAVDSDGGTSMFSWDHNLIRGA